MIELLRAEFLRLVSRRILWVLILGVAAVGAISTLSSLDMTAPISQAEQQEAQTFYQDELRAWEETCSDDPAECAEWPRPSLEQYYRTVWTYEEFIDNALFSGSFVALIAAMVLGVGLVGGEINSGTMATQLTFTPARSRVFVAKVSAGLAGGFLIALTFVASTVVLGTLSHLLMRGADDVTAGPNLPLALLRLLLAGTILAALGAVVTLGLGSSGGAGGLLGAVAFGSLVVSQSLGAQSALLPLLPWPNLYALVLGHYEHWGPPDFDLQRVFGYWHALNYTFVAMAVVTAVSVWAFRRKDVLG